jgi:hypothetical protein
VARPTFGKRDVANVARETLQTWQERRFKRGKTDVSNVASETLQTWQVRRFRRGKRDVLKVARPTGGGISSDVVAMGATLLNVARTTSIRWQQRRGCYGSDNLGGGKRDVSDVAIPTGRE